MHIADNTPESIKIVIYIVMLLLIYIAYQVFLILWDTKRMEQLLSLKRELKKYKSEKHTMKNTQNNMSIKESTVSDQALFSEEEKEMLRSAGRL